MAKEAPNPVNDQTIFERYPGQWRVFAVALPAAFAGSSAGDLAEQYGLSGAPRILVSIGVCVVLFLPLYASWARVLRWLGERRASRPTA